MTLNIVYNPFTDNFDYVAGSGGSGGGGGVIAWIDVTGTTQDISPDYGYTADNASQPVIFTLPVMCPYGSYFRIAGKGDGGWIINQNIGQSINFGDDTTTTGIHGTLSSTDQFDSIEVLCTVQNTTFTVIGGPIGNISFS